MRHGWPTAHCWAGGRQHSTFIMHNSLTGESGHSCQAQSHVANQLTERAAMHGLAAQLLGPRCDCCDCNSGVEPKLAFDERTDVEFFLSQELAGFAGILQMEKGQSGDKNATPELVSDGEGR